jgi:hypothetical protein
MGQCGPQARHQAGLIINGDYPLEGLGSGKAKGMQRELLGVNF